MKKLIRIILSPLVFIICLLIIIIPFPFGVIMFFTELGYLIFYQECDLEAMFAFILFPIDQTYRFINYENTI
jgi:hypothetical protein